MKRKILESLRTLVVEGVQKEVITLDIIDLAHE